jgi:transposase
MKEKHYLGIDVSLRKLNLHSTGPVPGDWTVPNEKGAVEGFIREQKLNPEEYIVGAESTSRYHLLCQEIFVRAGYEFRILNPILTGKKIAVSIRKKKTDISDAAIIANLLRQGEGRIVTENQLNTVKRTILRARKTVVNHRAAVRVLLKDIKRDTNIAALGEAVSVLENLADKMADTVEELNVLSENCQPSTNEEKLIRSIPGFAATLSAIVSSEVGDFGRFPSATQFKAYVGIDPKVVQSGDSLKNGKITKRGNVHLRSAFYLAAQVARCHDPELKAFYQKKKGEGKPTRVAICAVARKLCERVYAVVTEGRPYEIRRAENM